MMEFPMDLDEWPPTFGVQFQPFDADPTKDQLFGGRSDGCEYGVFDNDIADRGQDLSISAAWSNDYDYGSYNSGYGLTPSPLAYSPEQHDDLFATCFPPKVFTPAKHEPITGLVQPSPAASPTPELPTSPEDYFANVCLCPPSPGFVPVVTTPFPVILGGGVVANLPGNGKAMGFEAAEYNQAVVVPDVYEAGVKCDVEDMLFELDDMDSDVVIDHEKLASIGPSFPSVSLDDVLSLLPSEVPSAVSAAPPMTTVSSSLSETPMMATIYLVPVASPDANSTPGFISDPNSPVSSMVSSPTSTFSAESVVGVAKPPAERRLRKKEQNKTAAQRYREKKRGEHGSVLSEYELLEQRNTQLRSKVDDMTKEIAYLKGLIEEICA